MKSSVVRGALAFAYRVPGAVYGAPTRYGAGNPAAVQHAITVQQEAKKALSEAHRHLESARHRNGKANEAYLHIREGDCSKDCPRYKAVQEAAAAAQEALRLSQAQKEYAESELARATSQLEWSVTSMHAED